MKKLITLLFLICCSVYSQTLSVFDIDLSYFPINKAKFFAFDAAGEQITNLSPSDFEIKEDGISRNVISVKCKDVKPPDSLSSVLTIDISGSMQGQRLIYAQNAATAWVDGLDIGKSECALTTFNSSNYFNQDFTTDKQLLYNAINNIKAGGGTDFNAGFINPMAGALLAVEKGKYKRVVVFLTDGQAKGNEAAIIQKAKQINATVYCVTLDMKCPQILKNIAEQTGGLWFENIKTAEQAREIYEQILQIAQSGEPCEIEWESIVPCSTSPINLEVKLKVNLTFCRLAYNPPSAIIANLNFQPTAIVFIDAPKGLKKDTLLTVTAEDADIIVTDIKSSYKAFDINPKSFSLKKNQSQQLIVSFTPLDSEYAFTYFDFQTNLCIWRFMAAGYYTNYRNKNSLLKLTKPNGGEKYLVRSDTMITWEGIPANETVKLEYSIDDGSTWKLITNNASDLKYTWKNIPKP
ncbi:MAG: hypothetical protein QG635_766, partial [Bacteroidota bacterium]|nr:hypothetical protein [Bacteroidota bacterium]